MKKVGKTFLYILSKLWRRQTLILLALFVVLSSIFLVYATIPEGASIAEQETAQQSGSIRLIIDNPVNAPYKLVSLGFMSFSPSIKVIRAVSFIFYVLACIAMFYALRHWHTLQASVITTTAFATNAIVLACSRLGTPLITLMSFYIFSSMILWQLHSKSNKLVPFLVLLASAILLYTPGAIWFVAILGIVYSKYIKMPFRNVKKQAIIVGLILSVSLLTPLINSFVGNPEHLREWMLLPDNLVWSEIPKSILQVPSAFIYRMPVEPLINVARLPIFDLSAGVLFLVGLNAYRRKMSMDRTKLMLVSAVFGTVIGALGETLLAVIFLLPFAYSVIAAGIEYLLDEWYSVFPRNPLARSFGLLLVTFAGIFSIYYQVTRFFVVWPQTPETRAIYNQSRIIEK